MTKILHGGRIQSLNETSDCVQVPCKLTNRCTRLPIPNCNLTRNTPKNHKTDKRCYCYMSNCKFSQIHSKSTKIREPISKPPLYHTLILAPSRVPPKLTPTTIPLFRNATITHGLAQASNKKIHSALHPSTPLQHRILLTLQQPRLSVLSSSKHHPSYTHHRPVPSPKFIQNSPTLTQAHRSSPRLSHQPTTLTKHKI
ncbi:hypothetical protein KC19_4G192200 [Ceratodon purpureus]|uniref:Uncharacterized protein n=1 Tax=Ceratodon purpureus TaxID=3225 RepID=A0A8T0IDX3_CERPU|nr:hypothetical protein KC19_4G192200 [Ceratodon purpureus]